MVSNAEPGSSTLKVLKYKYKYFPLPKYIPSTFKMYLSTISSTFQLASNFFYPDNQTSFLNKNNLIHKQQTTSTVTLGTDVDEQLVLITPVTQLWSGNNIWYKSPKYLNVVENQSTFIMYLKGICTSQTSNYVFGAFTYLSYRFHTHMNNRRA